MERSTLSPSVVDAKISASPLVQGRKRVLNIGAGPVGAGKLHAGFDIRTWDEIRLDIDPAARPDLIGTVVAMHHIVPNASLDAVWCSHTLEHLHSHEVVPALKECIRVLKSDGFALVTSPDVAAIARQILRTDIDDVAYVSPAGPVTALDMLFGHAPSIRVGNAYMAHKTGFTADRLGRLATEAGFSEVRVCCGHAFDLWAILMLPDTDRDDLLDYFQETNVGQLLF